MLATVETVVSVDKEREEGSRFLLRSIEHSLAGGFAGLVRQAPYPPIGSDFDPIQCYAERCSPFGDPRTSRV